MTRDVKVFGNLPSQGTSGSVGYDLEVKHGCVLGPHATEVLGTWTWLDMPPGMSCDVRPRSSASKQGLLVHYGTIDTDYRGEIKITVTNLNDHPVSIEPGKRIAQLVFRESRMSPRFRQVEFDELSSTSRGFGGYGSTGE